jgi:RimJ/RimL family protein N-acetyltransferase
MDPLTYLLLQMGLEGKGLVGEHTIRQVQNVPGEELPLLLLAQLADQKLVAYYSESLSSNLQTKLSASISSIEFPEITPIMAVLKLHNIRPDIDHYKTYLFPPQIRTNPEVICLSKHDPKAQAFGFDGFAEHVYAIEQSGRIISACVSVREDQNCGEAWVYTDPAYRRQGLANKVVSTWAHSLMRVGKVPFYSHKIENDASARLAEALGLQPVFEEISITRDIS